VTVTRAGSGADPVLEVVDVSRRYGRRWALRHVTLGFGPATVTAVLGDNGAGKSTLLQILAGLLRPNEGEVYAFGEAVGGLPPRDVRERVAVLMHQPGVYPDLTGRENLRFYARLHGQPHDGAALDAWLGRVGLADAADRPVRTYSRGMIQRLALARIILQDAEVWLLDEPTTGLDASGVALLASVLAEARARGKTVVAVTHDLPALGAAVDRVVRLSGGRVRAGDVAAAGAPSAPEGAA